MRRNEFATDQNEPKGEFVVFGHEKWTVIGEARVTTKNPIVRIGCVKEKMWPSCKKERKKKWVLGCQSSWLDLPNVIDEKRGLVVEKMWPSQKKVKKKNWKLRQAFLVQSFSLSFSGLTYPFVKLSGRQ